MKKIWYEAYVTFEDGKCLIVGKRHYKTMEDAQKAINDYIRCTKRYDTTIRRNGIEYQVCNDEIENHTYSIARFEADVEEMVVEERKANPKLKALYNNKNVEIETTL